jgi:hypothetical protein
VVFQMISRERGWYLIKREPVRGSCGICGDEGFGELNLVRYWDCDDGWRAGPLCSPCLRFPQPPSPSDYAYGSDTITEDDFDGDYN